MLRRTTSEKKRGLTRPPLLFFGLSLSLISPGCGCDMAEAERSCVALTTPQPHTTVPAQPRKTIGRRVLVLPNPSWLHAQLRGVLLVSVTSQFVPCL